MPKAKRAQVVHLTKVKPATKGRAIREAFINKVREAFDSYSSVYLFSVKNMRNAFFQDLRQSLKHDSRIFFGKVKLMAKAAEKCGQFGEAVTKELAERLKGNVCLLFTNLSGDEVTDAVSSIGERDFERPGQHALDTVTIEAGPLHQMHDPSLLIPTTQENMLKHSGLSNIHRDKEGRLAIPAPHVLCRKGDKLTVEQCKLLRSFGVMRAEFSVCLLSKCLLDPAGATFEELHANDEIEEDVDAGEDDTKVNH